MSPYLTYLDIITIVRICEGLSQIKINIVAMKTFHHFFLDKFHQRFSLLGRNTIEVTHIDPFVVCLLVFVCFLFCFMSVFSRYRFLADRFVEGTCPYCNYEVSLTWWLKLRSTTKSKINPFDFSDAISLTWGHSCCSFYI